MKQSKAMRKLMDLAAFVPRIVPPFAKWEGGMVATDEGYAQMKAQAKREGRLWWAKGPYYDCWFVRLGNPWKSLRPVCGARTRAGGSCKAKAAPGKMKCRLHGGCSTGPTTPEGKARIAESNRRRAKR